VGGPIVSRALSLPCRDEPGGKSYSTYSPSIQSELFDTALENCRAQTQQMPGASQPPSPPRPCGMPCVRDPSVVPPAGVFFIRSQCRSSCHPAQTDGRQNDGASSCRPAHFGIFAPLAVQIMSQLVDGELMITNNIFDQIADRDDSDQLSLVNDRKVAYSLLGHHRHAFFSS
jgi:hypothetical protein